jgi:hypothetical protein
MERIHTRNKERIMAGSINEFKSSFTKDLARANRFDVFVPIPLVLLPYFKSTRTLKFRCESAQLPGKSFATIEQKFGSAPVEKFPYMTNYQDIDLTFLIDDDMQQKLLFDGWMNYISPVYNFNFRYKSDYTTAITINQYDVQNELTYSVNLYDAYPIAMSQMDLNWNNDGIHKLVITFAYTNWQNNSLQDVGMQLLDYGINGLADAIAGADIFGPDAGIGSGSLGADTGGEVLFQDYAENNLESGYVAPNVEE